jgi:hypothetical protein
MPQKRLSFSSMATVAMRGAWTHPSYWLPALVLLAPTLVLQLAAPTSDGPSSNCTSSPHGLTTAGAYVRNAATLTFQALCISVLFDEARGVSRVGGPARDVRRVRTGQVTAAAAALGALVAAVYKIQHHLY